MSSVRTTALNIASLLFGRLGYRITTALALILIARTVEHEAYGIFTTALAWSSVTLSLNDLGLSTYLLKTASKKDPEFSTYFGNTLSIQIALSTIICILLTCIGVVALSPTLGLLIGLVSFGQLAYEFRKTFRAVFRSHQQLKSVAFTELATGAVFLILVFVITQLSVEKTTLLFWFAGASVCAQLMNITILGIQALRLERPHLELNILPRMLGAAKHFFFYNIFLLLYFQIDQILISLIISPKAVAVYSAPAQIINVLLFIPLMVFQATTPFMFAWFDVAKEKYIKLLNLQWRYLLACSVPIGVGISILATHILQLVYGAQFFDAPTLSDSASILQLFALFLMLRFSAVVLMNALMTSDNARIRMRFQLAAVVGNVLLDLILIPYLGVIGAALSTVVVETLVLIILVVTHARVGLARASHMLPTLFRVIVATIVMGVAVFLLRELLPVIVLSIGGACIYLGTLLLSGFFTADDRTLFVQFRKNSL
ncbi:MAG: flippase [Candidatus Kerfeldbacteria bacterium]|nr:flippase [Candidatus Kerfeldbacteria bacterium]